MDYKKKFVLWLLILGGCNIGVRQNIGPSSQSLYKGSSPSAHANRPRLGQWIFPPNNLRSRVKGSPIYFNKYLNLNSFDFPLSIARKAREAADIFDDAVARVADAAARAAEYAYVCAAVSTHATLATSAHSAASSCLARADAALHVNRAHLVYDSVIKVCETPMDNPHDMANYLSKLSSINLLNDIACSAAADVATADNVARAAADLATADNVARAAADLATADNVARAAADLATVDAAAANTAKLLKTLRWPADRVVAAIDTL